jgi:diaminopimelate dehydrogenase
MKGEEKRIERTIYRSENFKDCDTEVRFVSSDELSFHKVISHKGQVGATDRTDPEQGIIRAVFTVEMDSNPDFTASILLASARATYRLYNEGKYGALTLFDVPPSYFYHSDPYSYL